VTDADGGADRGQEDGDGAQMLDFEGLKQREERKRQATKEFIVEYEDGAQAVFEYQMVDGVDTIIRDHMVRKPTRTGQDPEQEIDNEYALARDVFKEGLVDAPDGFELSERALREVITDELMDELYERIINFSSADEVTVRKFRGLGLRE
jgi:hypothetical protein